MPTEPPCRVILLGMMGSGKTTLGNALAGLTGWSYLDNDALLAAATGRTARDLALEGTVALREAEAAALRLALAQQEPAIVAAAAGVVLDAELRRALRAGGTVVWLHAPPAVLAERALRGPHRPWLEADVEGWMAAAAAERELLYRSVADLDVNTHAEQPLPASRRIVAALAGRGCGRWLPRGTPLANKADETGGADVRPR